MTERSNQEITSVPHSGNLPEGLREQPVNDFDNTSLPQAYEQGHIVMPDSPAPLIREKEEDKEKKPWYTTLAFKVGASVVGAAVATTLAAGLLIPKGDNDQAENVPQDDPNATSQPEVTDNTENQGSKNNSIAEHDSIVTPENSQERLESLRISESLSNEEKAQKVIELSNRWTTAGATPELFEVYYKGLVDGNGKDAEAVAHETALANAPVYAEAVYGSERTDSIQTSIDRSIKANEDFLIRYLKTFGTEENPNSNSKNKEAYEESLIGTQLTGWASSEESSTPELADYYARARSAYGDNAEVYTFTATRENNAESTMYKDNPEYAAVDNKLQYFNTVLVPDGTGNLVVRYVNMSDTSIMDIQY